MNRGEIPAGWKRATIGEIAEFRRGFSWKKEAERHEAGDGRVPVLRIPNIQDRLRLDDLLYVQVEGSRDLRRFGAGKGWSLLVGSNGNPKRVGNCVYIDRDSDFLFASFLLAAGPIDGNEVVGEYLFRLLASDPVQRSITENVQGSTGLKNIRLESLKQVEVLVPPLKEQRKIAAILSSIDDSIAATNGVLNQLIFFKDQIIGEFTARGLPGHHAQFKPTEIGEIPKAWRLIPLSEIAEVKGGKRMPKGHRFASFKTEFPYIRVSDFEDGTVRQDRLEYVLPGDRESIKSYTISKDDLYISIAGTLGLIGEIPKILDGAQLTENAAKICKIKGTVDRLFLMFALQGQRSQGQVMKLKGVGGGVPKLALFRIESIRIALPPIDEQREITDVLLAAVSRIRSERSYLERLKILKAALLSVLLSGEVQTKFGSVPA